MTWIITERGVLVNLDHVAAIRAHANGVVEAEGLVEDKTITTLASNQAEGNAIVEYIALSMHLRTAPLDFRPGHSTHNDIRAAFEKQRSAAGVQHA